MPTLEFRWYLNRDHDDVTIPRMYPLQWLAGPFLSSLFLFKGWPHFPLRDGLVTLRVYKCEHEGLRGVER